MCQKNDLPLSLKSDTFGALHSDFDQVLRSTLTGMDETGQDVAEINIKVKITLTDDSAPDYSVAGGRQTREITKPKFEHALISGRSSMGRYMIRARQQHSATSGSMGASGSFTGLMTVGTSWSIRYAGRS